MTAEKEPSAFPAGNGETVEHVDPGVTLESLADLKRLPQSELAEHGCAQRMRNGRPVVSIPYHGVDGGILAVRFRNALSKNPDGADDRFRWRSGDKAVHLYGLTRLDVARAAGWVLVVEGESDCWTGWHYGLPVVGVPGKSNWKPRMAQHLAGLDVYVWQEPDAEDFPERIGRDLPDLRVIVAPEGVKDISDAHVEGRDVVALVDELRASALPLSEIVARRHEARLPDLRAAARRVFEHPDPLALFRDSIAAQGYGGDLGAPTVVLLALTGRVLAMRTGTMPVHLLVLGPASAGKSYALGVALIHLPEVAYHLIDAGSPRTLIYDDADLEHRVAVFGEADSLPAGEDNPAASAIRNMLADHRLHYAVTVRDPVTGDFTVREISKPGPTTMVTTSTRRLGPQLDTRVFILEVPDDHAQLGHALRAQASLELAGGSPDPDPALIAYQEYLQEMAPWDVVVPFALKIAQHLASQPGETRVVRDFARLLSLVKAVTVLRHPRRGRDHSGRWVAEPEDYAEVFRLVGEVYKASNSGAGQKVREVVRAVADHIAAGHVHASQTDLMGALNLTRAAVSRRVAAAKRGGWLIDDETVKGRPAKLRIGEPLPSDCGLPTPEQIGCSTVSAFTGGQSDGCLSHDGSEPADLAPVELVPSAAEVAAQRHEDSRIPVIRHAADLVIAVGAASSALLQKRLGLYEAEAEQVLDLLEAAGVVGPNGSKSRVVLVDQEEADRLIDARLEPSGTAA
jgi:hypothetical protein